MSFNNSENSEHLIKMYANSTDHYHPLRSSPNKILFNKEKLNEGIRNMESITMLPVKEKIYYNPKFLINHVKTAASAYINNANSISENKSDTKIHINRNYLANLNLSNYTSSNDVKANVKPQSRGGIYINPKFINRNLVKDDSNLSGAISNLSDNNDIFNSNILMIKNSDLKKAIPEKNNFKTSPSSKSKYKFIKSVSSPKSSYKLIKTIANPPKCQSSPKPLCIKTKYSLKRLNVAKSFNKDSPTLKSALLAKIKTAKTIPELNKLNKTKLVRKASSEFKKLSSTKLVRKSVLQSLILARRHYRNKLFRKFTYNLNKRLPKKKSSNLSYFPKIKNQKYEIYKKDNTIREKYQKINNIMNLKNESICNSSFKKIGKMKIVRKSLLKAQIEARSQVKNQYLRDYRNWMEFYSRKYTKFNTRNDIRMKFIDKQKALLKWRKKKQAPDTSRVKCKRTSSHAQTSKHLRKNNQPCPFYNRFGRCKGKDKGTCPKLHDSLYISICRKLLHGECNTKDCLLSHDIRPGKMPTCHHYLAGLCTRPNCPFLHIKVNPKAPICAAFLQGFCPDVFNCLKRHEFICPIFAEKGNCPRGKSCTYPHRSPVVHSKLLKDDQKPLIKRTTDSLINTNNVSNTKEVSASSKKINSKNNQTDEKNLNKKFKKEYVKEAFTRYFAVSNSDATLDNSVDDIDSKENISSQKQNSEESS